MKAFLITLLLAAGALSAPARVFPPELRAREVAPVGHVAPPAATAQPVAGVGSVAAWSVEFRAVGDLSALTRLEWKAVPSAPPSPAARVEVDAQTMRDVAALAALVSQPLSVPPMSLTHQAPLILTDLGRWRARLIRAGQTYGWDAISAELELYCHEFNEQISRRARLLRPAKTRTTPPAANP